MTDSFDPVTPSQPDTGLGFTVSRTHLLIALGGLFTLAFTLSLLNARKKSGVQKDSTLLITDDWRESIAHLASAWDYRYAGMENRMEGIERMLRAALGEPEPQYGVPISNIPTTAATSGPVGEPVQANGTHPPVGAEEPPPPGPANVSL